MNLRALLLSGAFLVTALYHISLRAQTQASMVPFTMDPRTAAHAHSPVDVSFLLDAPAGKHGYVIVKDGHLATQNDGQRIRFWGVNITDWSSGSRQVPSKHDAPYIAETLARFGVNAVRFQFLDLQAPRGLVTAGDNTRTLDTAQVDLEDFFIAELEKRGIYIDFNLLVGRPFKAADGVQDAKLLHEGAKGISLYDARMIELQKEYAKELLDHTNPYTNRRYTQDPAVAIVEINNEDAVDVGFHPPSTFYGDELTTLYNQWLAKHRSSEQIASLRQLTHATPDLPVALLSQKGQPATAPTERFNTEAEFYNDLQRSYFEEMEHYLKSTLGSRSLVIATADHNHAASGYPVLLAERSMDIIDGHTYWQHPEYYVHKLPMVDDPFNSTVVELSRSAMLNKPYMVSEVNEPFPNDYAGEGIPILAAYGSFQDWDGIFWYTFEPKSDPNWKAYVGDPFDISRDPVKMPELAAGALLFLRSDVEKARNVNVRSYSQQQVFDSMLLPSSDRPYFTPGFPLSLPLEQEVRISSLRDSATRSFSDAPRPDPIVSDTGQLRWYSSSAKSGLVTVDSPRTQALIGFVKSQNRPVSKFSAHVKNDFCTLILTAMDAQPVADSSRLLLVAGGMVRNTGQTWNVVGTDVTAWGVAPTLINTVKGTITLKGIEKARSIRLQALDGAGQPLGAPVLASRSQNEWTVPLGDSVTTWYEVTVQR